MTDRPQDGDEQTFDVSLDQDKDPAVERASEEEVMSEGAAPEEEDSFFSGEEDVASETWEDDLPPEDDFQDLGGEAGDEAMIEDPAPEGAYEDVYAEEEAPEAASRRGKGVLFGVLAVGAVLVGGLIYLQFSSDLSGRDVPLAPAVDTRQPSARPDDFAQTAQPAEEEKGETDLAALYQDAKKQTDKAASDLLPGGEVSAAPQSVSSDIVTMDDATIQKEAKEGAKEIAKIEEIPMPALQPEPAKEKKGEAVKPAPVQEPAASASALPVASAPTAVDMTAYDLRLKTMDRQIEALQSSLRQAVEENKKLAKKIESLEAVKAVGKKELVLAPENKELLDKISQLETMIKKQKAEAQKIVQKAARKPKAESQKTVQAPAPAVKPAPKKIVKAAPKPVTVKPSWVLRAATPDAAWVSKDKNSTALRRVAVGETLPGLGQIQAIRQKGGAWEVVGSLGILQ